MKLDLNKKNLLPPIQPFNVLPYDYNGQEKVNDIPEFVVDWVLVELRDANDSKKVLKRRATWIRQEGDLYDVDGKKGMLFKELAHPQYYVAVIPRGHLAILSKEPIQTRANEASLDFTLSDTNTSGENQLKKIGTSANIYAQIAGDFDSNGIINNLDFNLWQKISAGLNTYVAMDVYGNGVINNLDFNLWALNRSRIGKISF